MRHIKFGFTLIELSIVLVIIALVVGGVLVGQDLILAAKIRQFGSQIEEYQTALFTFRGKYNALPGDMPNATSFWPAVSNGCTDQQGTGLETCNGNGNGIVGDVLNSNENYEIFRFWQHLSNAGLIKTSVTGVPGALGYRDAVAGVNVPVSTFAPGVGFSIVTVDMATVTTYSSYYFSSLAGTSYTIGGELTGYEAYELLKPWLSGKDAYSIDIKFDDGRAGQGKIFGSPISSAFASQCTTSDDPVAATYNLTDSTHRCHLNVRILPGR